MIWEGKRPCVKFERAFVDLKMSFIGLAVWLICTVQGRHVLN